MWRWSLLATALLHAAPADARSEILQNSSAVPFAILDQTLVGTLEEFGSSAGLPMTVDRRISGRVTNFYAQLSARGFLDQLAADHGLVWYFDGSSVHVTPASANGSVIIDFTQVSAAQLNRTLEQMGVADARFSLRQTEDSGIGVITGPPRYVEIVQSAFLMLAKRTKSLPAPTAASKRITVIRGEQVEVWSGGARISTTDTAPITAQDSEPVTQDTGPADTVDREPDSDEAPKGE